VDASEVAGSAFAMPLTSPSYPRGPYRFTNREHLIVTYRTDPAALELAVPEPLEVGDPLVRLEFMRMEGSTGFGRYSGAAQHIPVRFGAQTGAYTHNMFLDVHAPISGGRELWGFPQKLAAPRLAVAHDVLLGILNYGPERVATATMGYKARTHCRRCGAGDAKRARVPAQDHSARERLTTRLRAGALFPAQHCPERRVDRAGGT